MNRLTVAFVISRLGVGGAERQLIALVSALDPERFRPIVICLKDPGPLASELPAGVEHVSLERLNGSDPSVVNALVRALKSMHVDVVHCTNFNASAWGRLAAQRAGVPSVVADHSIQQHRSAKDRVLVRLANRVLDTGTAAIVACADAQVSDLVAEGCDLAHVEVIHNGVDPAVYDGLRARGRRLRSELGVPDTDVVVTAVANLAVRKNPMMLVEALGRLASDGLPVRLWLVGEGPMRPALEAAICSTGLGGRGKLLGSRRDVPVVLAGSDIAALSSDVETFPMCLLEAMASELPVVATAVGGTAEIVDAGVTGELVGSQDVAAFTSALRTLVEDSTLRSTYGSAGRARVVQSFTRDAMVSAYETLFLRVAGQR